MTLKREAHDWYTVVEEGEHMEYIMSNKDRLSIVDILQKVDAITITGDHTSDVDSRKWIIIATLNMGCGYIGNGSTICEAVEDWFKAASLKRPIPSTLYQLKMYGI